LARHKHGAGPEELLDWRAERDRQRPRLSGTALTIGREESLVAAHQATGAG